MTDAGIHFHDVTLIRDARRILSDVSLSLREQRVAILGPNGSGKSTLLRLINGLIKADQGTVRVDGLDPTREAARVRRKVGFVFQNPDAQIVMPTVDEEMNMGLKALKLTAAECEARTGTALGRFGLADRRQGSAHLLSGGEKRRLTLATVFAMGPDIIVMDEPTSMLDLSGTRQFTRFLDGLPQRVVMATHDLALAAACDRVVVLHGGAVIADDQAGPAIAAYGDLVDRLVAVGEPQ